jgi:hypothetical protein
MSSRAFLNSFMLCPRLRAKSGNFFAPKRTRTMRRMINRSGPPRFPIPNARIFITILNWSSPWFIPERRSNLVYNKRVLMISTVQFQLLRHQRCTRAVIENAAGGRKPGRESTASDPPGALFVSLVLLQLTPGIVCCRCQPHCEIKETFRLAIEKSVGREGLDCGYRTP